MLRECLSAVGRLDPRPAEVIVAIDGDSPGIRRLAGEFGFVVVNLPEAQLRSRGRGYFQEGMSK